MATDKRARISGGFGAGVGASLVMMLVMAVLRFTTNTISTPELVERSIVRLIGPQVELFFMNALGVGGQALLVVIMIERSLLLRGLLGWAFTRLWPARLQVAGWRWISGLMYGLIIGLLCNAAFMWLGLEDNTRSNIASSQFSSSLVSFGLPVWLNVFLVNIIYGLALVALLPWPRVAKAVPEASAPESVISEAITPQAVTMQILAPQASQAAMEQATLNVLGESMSRRNFTKLVTGGALAVVGGVPIWYGAKHAIAQTSLVTRATHAANTLGWRQLGVLDVKLQPGANFRESDILYNPDDRMYYVFSTEGDGNPPPSTNIISSTADTPTTILAPGHRVKVGMQVFISGHMNNSDGLISALNNRPAYRYYRVSAINIGGNPDTFQLVLWGDDTVPVSSTGGRGGLLNYSPNPHVAMRRASRPRGITQATGDDYVEYISSGIWYPTIIKEGSNGSSAWHLWGTRLREGTRVPMIEHRILEGNRPGPSQWPEPEGDTNGAGALQFLGKTPVSSPYFLGDMSVRRNPADGNWYAVGLNPGTNTDLRIYRSDDITSENTWHLIGSVFADRIPSWATASIPDPNICFADGRAYVLFTSGVVANQWNTGIVEVDLATGKAIGTAEILLKYGAYAPWMNSVLSDLVYVPSCHDGVDRIFAFGGVPYNSGKSATWGCLDLPAS